MADGIDDGYVEGHTERQAQQALLSHDAALLKHPEILAKIKEASTSDPESWVDVGKHVGQGD